MNISRNLANVGVKGWLIIMIVCLMPTLAEPAPPDFGRDVYPILQRACFECHGVAKQSGDLRLDTRAAIPVHLLNKSIEQNELIRRITLPAGHAEIMPAHGQPLSSAQQSILKQWIASGRIGRSRL